MGTLIEDPVAIRSDCPKCGSTLIRTKTAVWCTYIGSKKYNEPPCDFMLDIRPEEEQEDGRE